MPGMGILDAILWGILLVNFTITLMLMIGPSFWVAITAPYYNQTFQVINSTGGLTTVSGSILMANNGSVFPSNAMSVMQQYNETIITSLIPMGQNATFFTLSFPGGGTLSIPNPTNFVIILFNIFIIIWNFIYNWFWIAPHWVGSILQEVIQPQAGSPYIAVINTFVAVYSIFSGIAFFWFIINYVWQPLSWIVGFILGASQQFIQQILSKL